MPSAPAVQLGAVPAHYDQQLPSCPACDAFGAACSITYPDDVGEWARLSITICNRCGFGYVPDIHFDLDAYYANEYGITHGRRSLPGPRKLFGSLRTSNAPKVARAAWHARVLANVTGDVGSILDVGSGPGFLLWNVPKAKKFAVETDRFSIEYLEHIGATVFSEIGQAPGDVDVVAASHVLEHVPVQEMHGFVDACVGRLRPGGHLLLEVPEWGFLHHRRPKRGTHLPHVLFFSPKSFRSVVSRPGLRLRYFQTPGRVFDVDDHGDILWSSFQPNKSSSSVLMCVFERTV